MKDLLHLCAKNAHFTFSNEAYLQFDGTGMGSPLGRVLDGIFIVEFKRTLVPTLPQHMKIWKRYADETISIMKIRSIDYVQYVSRQLNENNDKKLVLPYHGEREEFQIKSLKNTKKHKNELYEEFVFVLCFLSVR